MGEWRLQNGPSKDATSSVTAVICGHSYSLSAHVHHGQGQDREGRRLEGTGENMDTLGSCLKRKTGQGRLGLFMGYTHGERRRATFIEHLLSACINMPNSLSL